MKCPLCGMNIDENAAARACASCPVNKGCKLMRCTNCGYDIPPEPKSLTLMKQVYEKVKAKLQDDKR